MFENISLRQLDETISTNPELKKMKQHITLLGYLSTIMWLVSIATLMYVNQPDEYYSHELNIAWGVSLILAIVLSRVARTKSRKLTMMVEDFILENKPARSGIVEN